MTDLGNFTRQRQIFGNIPHLVIDAFAPIAPASSSHLLAWYWHCISDLALRSEPLPQRVLKGAGCLLEIRMLTTAPHS